MVWILLCESRLSSFDSSFSLPSHNDQCHSVRCPAVPYPRSRVKNPSYWPAATDPSVAWQPLGGAGCRCSASLPMSRPSLPAGEEVEEQMPWGDLGRRSFEGWRRLLCKHGPHPLRYASSPTRSCRMCPMPSASEHDPLD